MKALGTGWRRGVRFRDIEVTAPASQPGRLRLHGRAAEIALERGGRVCHVALAPGRHVAVAVVVLEGHGDRGDDR